MISIVISFAIPKFSKTDEKINTTKLKSQLSLIQSSISSQKSKNILLSNSEKIDILDDSIIDKKDEKLFSKLVDFSIISTDSSEKKVGSWAKISSNSYIFYLDYDFVSFSLEDESFVCKSKIELCSEVE